MLDSRIDLPPILGGKPLKRPKHTGFGIESGQIFAYSSGTQLKLFCKPPKKIPPGKKLAVTNNSPPPSAKRRSQIKVCVEEINFIYRA